MKKNVTYIRNKKGSMLMLTLIVFMVILILGTTMVTSMLYSQGENNMQINEQKAYYAAKSAVDAIKSYFLNPTSNFISTDSITSPHDLIGTTGTYTLKAQGIDEDTTVSIKLTNEGPVPNESSKNYILIEATGNCQGESSTVKVRMIEEIKKGASGGLYSSEVVFGSTWLQANAGSIIKGNIYIDSGDSQGYVGTINNLKMVKTEEYDSTLYIKSNGEFQFADNNLIDVYMEINPNGYMGILNNEADNMYIRNISLSNSGSIQVQSNTIRGELQIHSVLGNLTGYTNKVSGRLILGFDRQTNGIQIHCDVPEVYVNGLKKYDMLSLSGNIKNIYVDEEVEGNLPANAIPADLSYVKLEEQRIATVISGLSEVKNVLETRPNWDKEIIKQNYQEVSEKEEGVLEKDPLNYEFEEYYDISTNTRWVFTNDNHGIAQGYTLMSREDYNEWNTNSRIYYISDNPIHKDDTIFFINHNKNNILISPNSNARLENVYIYTPNSECSFQSNFEYFGGSIIAQAIKSYGNGPKEIEFKTPNAGIITGAPSSSGDTNNAGSSSGTTYTYKFESYVDPKKVS